MKKRTAWLSGLVVLALVGALTAARAQLSTPTADFSGHWHWSHEQEELTLYLTQSGSALRGHHTAVGQGGMKVDEVEETGPSSISGDVHGNTATITFRSGFPGSRGGGRASLSLRGNWLYWKILESTGEHYLPSSAKLSRVN